MRSSGGGVLYARSLGGPTQRQAPSPWREPRLVHILLVATLFLAGREAVVGFFGVWFQAIGMLYQIAGERWLWMYVVRLVVGVAMVGMIWQALVVRRQSGSMARRDVVMALVPLLLTVGYRYMRDTRRAGVLEFGFVLPRDVAASFPYRANTSHWDQEGSVRAEAHIDARGRRVCGEQPTAPSQRVAMIGDSWVYGKAVVDDQAPCWQLRDRLDASGHGTVALDNLGQAGANLESYVSTLEWIADTARPDVATMGLLLPNDGEFIDLNDDYWLVRHPVFRVVASLLEPELAYSGLRVFAKTYVSAGFYPLAVRHGLEDLDRVTRAHELPVLLYIQNDQVIRPPTGDALAYAEAIEDRFRGHPYVHYVGITPTVSPQEGVLYVMDQGHPTAPAYSVHMDWLHGALVSYIEREASR